MKAAESCMRQVLALAAEALELGEFPIAAIVVLDDEILSQAATSEQREKRFLGHAELVALEEADKQQLSFAERSRANTRLSFGMVYAPRPTVPRARQTITPSDDNPG